MSMGIINSRWCIEGSTLCAATLLLLLLANVIPARQRQPTDRRLSEDAALSAALNGLPVSPSAQTPVGSAVNVYGLDPSLLAALQQSGANASGSNQNGTNASQQGNQAAYSRSGAAQVPASGPAIVSATPQAGVRDENGGGSSTTPGAVSSSSLRQTYAGAWAPVPAPAPTAWSGAPASGPSSRGPSTAPPRSIYAPLDPHLAAALENQGRLPPSPASTPSIASTPRAPAPGPGSASSTLGGSVSSSGSGSGEALAPAASIFGPALAPGYAPAQAPAAAVAPVAAVAPASDSSRSSSGSVAAAGVVSGDGATVNLQPLCNDRDWQASSLKLLQERPFASLFSDSFNMTSFDPTGLEQVNSNYYVVFNRSQTIACIPNRLTPLDNSNKLVSLATYTNVTVYEGIAYQSSTGGFLAVQERRISEKTGVELRPVIHELEVANDLRSYSVKRRCWVAFNLSEEVTGFQDIQFHVDQSGNKWLLGLCDGNHCAGGALGRDRGSGRIVVAQMRENNTRCAWVPQRVLSVPATAAFSGYTGFAIRGNRILIASRDDSAVWLGRLNWESWEFIGEGAVYQLPRNDACQVVFCNMRAVQWLDDRRISVASGVAPPGSPWPCHSKAESLHQFLLPASAMRDVDSA